MPRLLAVTVPTVPIMGSRARFRFRECTNCSLPLVRLRPDSHSGCNSGCGLLLRLGAGLELAWWNAFTCGWAMDDPLDHSSYKMAASGLSTGLRMLLYWTLGPLPPGIYL